MYSFIYWITASLFHLCNQFMGIQLEVPPNLVLVILSINTVYCQGNRMHKWNKWGYIIILQTSVGELSSVSTQTIQLNIQYKLHSQHGMAVDIARMTHDCERLLQYLCNRWKAICTEGHKILHPKQIFILVELSCSGPHRVREYLWPCENHGGVRRIQFFIVFKSCLVASSAFFYAVECCLSHLLSLVVIPR